MSNGGPAVIAKLARHGPAAVCQRGETGHVPAMFPVLLALVSMAVQPDTGALALSLDGKPVITGVAAQQGFKAAHTAVHQDSPTHCTINTDYANGSRAVCTYALDGQDCTLNYTLTNGGAQPLTMDLGGLSCALAPGAPLKGTLSWWHATYFASTAVWHPSVLSPLGVVYATDAQTAAVFYSPSEFGRRSLINAGWEMRLGIPNPFRLEFHTQRTVPPGASDRVSLVLRVTKDLSQEGLHGGYKRFLAEKYPAPRYVPAPGPIVQFSSVDAGFVKPDNPHGYNGDERRIDRPEGVAKFLHWIAEPLAAAHGQGCIFWAPGGVEKIMYPPDFDTNLARIADTWPTLAAGFHARGLRVGICARAAETLDRADPEHPVPRLIDPDDSQQVKTLLDRFRNAARMGVDAYYLDTFGGDWSSTRLLPAIRETVGPGVPIYTEYCTDATLPYADRYCEYKGGDGVSWDSPDQLAALRFLFPQSVWLCVSRLDAPWPAAYERLHLTPLIQDYLVKDRLPTPQ